MVRRVAVITIPAVIVLSFMLFAQTDGIASDSIRHVKLHNTKATMTVVGCLMKESEYRKTHELGKGYFGGADMGDEFVLYDAAILSPSFMATKNSPTITAVSNPTGCGTPGNGEFYRVTGTLEHGLMPYVGHRIEVSGRFDSKRDAKTALGLTHAELPAEIRLASFREVTTTTTTTTVASAATTRESTTTTAPQAVAVAPPPENPPAPQIAQAPPPAPAPRFEEEREARNETRRPLPKTAGVTPLTMLLGLMSLSGGVFLTLLRKSPW